MSNMTIRQIDRSISLQWILLLMIVVIGIILRVEAQNHLRVISLDGIMYIYRALSVLIGVGHFERRGPLFQLLLMISYKIFGVSFESSVLVPQFFGGIVPILLFLLGKRFFDSKTGLIAALLGAFNPLLINLSCWVLRETLTLALILMLILAAHFTVKIRSKKRSLIASTMPGFLSGLLILTREEMLFVIPPAYIAYAYFYEKKRLNFMVKTSVFIITTTLVMIPWLLYSSTQFGDPFYSYWFYLKNVVGGVGTEVPGAEGVSVPVFPWLLGILPAILFGLWREMIELPAVLSLLGFLFLPVGVMLTVKKRAIWVIYFIMASDLFILSPIMSLPGYLDRLSMPYQWINVSRFIFPSVMPTIIITAYGIRSLVPFLTCPARFREFLKI